MAEDEENLNPMPEPQAREGDAFFARFSIRTPVFSFSFSLKIADQRLATTVVVGCGVALAAFLYRYPESVGSAVRSALEGPGLQVQNIISNSIIVRMRCDGEESLLEIVENFEKKKVKKKLEEAFRKIGCLKESEELVVTIMDKENVYRKVDEIRKKLEEENLSSETLKRDAQEMHSSKTSAQEKTLKKERVPAQVETGVWLCIGVDVGGTHTDAVILRNKEVLFSAKVLTTDDISTGVSEAIKEALSKLSEELKTDPAQYVARINIGTTHFVNAIVQRKGLTKVAVLRLCGSASRAIPPLCDFPADLKKVIGGMYFFLNGGYQYDGSPITEVDEEGVKRTIKEVHNSGIRNVVIAGVFSPASGEQENQVAGIIKSVCPEMSMTLSREVGLIGLLERENAAVLNESLKPLCQRTVAAFCRALTTLGLKCPLYLTQNDGTIISAERSRHLPVYTYASGATNSMRGAAFLSGAQDAIVVDIGGNTTEVGVTKRGFPKQGSTRVKIGGVITNLRMPDILSVALGGGSIVKSNGVITVGPDSVGKNLTFEALVFDGGKTTSTDIAVASGFYDYIGDKEKVNVIPEDIRIRSLQEIKRKIEAAIDQMKLSAEDQLVVLVGGGSILVKPGGKQTLKGTSYVIRPIFCQVANAVGAALSKVSGTFDQVIPMENKTRAEAREFAENEARKKTLEAGADEQTLEVIDLMEVPLAYLPGNAVRYYLKVVGDLAEPCADVTQQLSEFDKEIRGLELAEESATTLQAPPLAMQFNVEEDAIVLKDPYIDPVTGDWILNEFDIKCISIGAGIMGCGGGGSAYLGRLKALEVIKAGKEIRVIHPSRLGSSPELTGPVGMSALMGSPMIDLEKLFSGRETTSALEAVQAILFSGSKIKERNVAEGIRGVEDVQDLISLKIEPQSDKKLVAIMPADIGGVNSLEPLTAGAALGLPIVDADGVGRAFPELQMTLPFVYGSPPYPAALSDDKGNAVALTFADSPKRLEDFFRAKTVGMGGTSGLACVLDWRDVKEKCVLYSLSRVWRLGNSVLRARQNKKFPVDTICEHENGKLLITGMVTDTRRVSEGAFNTGSLTIKGSAQFSGKNLGIEFQNENYVAFILRPDGSKDILATVPDLISLVDEDTGEPITTEEVHYNLRVSVIVMPCSPKWTTPQGLATVGPEAFGYRDVVYSPISAYKEHPPKPVAKT